MAFSPNVCLKASLMKLCRSQSCLEEQGYDLRYPELQQYVLSVLRLLVDCMDLDLYFFLQVNIAFQMGRFGPCKDFFFFFLATVLFY